MTKQVPVPSSPMGRYVAGAVTAVTAAPPRGRLQDAFSRPPAIGTTLQGQ